MKRAPRVLLTDEVSSYQALRGQLVLSVSQAHSGILRVAQKVVLAHLWEALDPFRNVAVACTSVVFG